jgi:hypothetical protein
MALEQINKRNLDVLIKKAIAYGGIIEKDAIALQTERYSHMSAGDKIRWLEKACDNAVYCGQYKIMELMKEVERTPIF